MDKKMGKLTTLATLTVLFSFICVMSVYAADMVITIKPDNPYFNVDGTNKEIDPGRGTAPFIDPTSQRTFVPINAIFTEFGGVVGYDAISKEVTITMGAQKLRLAVGRYTAYAGDTNFLYEEMTVAPLLKNDRTFMPINYIMQYFGIKVEFDSATKSTRLIKSSHGISDVRMENIAHNTDSWDFDANYIQVSGLSDKVIEELVNYNLKWDMSDFAEYEQDESFAIDPDYEGNEYKNALVAQCALTYNKNNFISTTYIANLYTGGAHPVDYAASVLVDLESNQMLDLSDLLKPEGVEFVNQQVRKHLQNLNNMEGYQIYNTDNFEIMEDHFAVMGSSIVIYFDPYEVAAYAAGFVTARISFDQLEEFIQPEYLRIMPLTKGLVVNNE